MDRAGEAGEDGDMIAILFAEKDGVYSNIPDIDVWDIERDARNYTGPYSVVAHPPCQLWGPFAVINYKRWGGQHNKPGNDGGCFHTALCAVRCWGGVLEHPAFTRAWAHFGLQRPGKKAWYQTGNKEWTCEVWQSAYGHLARKKTWLLYVGHKKPQDLCWDEVPGSHQIGFHDQRGKGKNKPTISGKKASATPIQFRDVLISLAREAASDRLRAGKDKT